MSGGLAEPHLRVPGPRPSCQFDRYLPRIFVEESHWVSSIDCVHGAGAHCECMDD